LRTFATDTGSAGPPETARAPSAGRAAIAPRASPESASQSRRVTASLIVVLLFVPSKPHPKPKASERSLPFFRRKPAAANRPPGPRVFPGEPSRTSGHTEGDRLYRMIKIVD